MAIATPKRSVVTDKEGRQFAVDETGRVRVWCDHRKRYIQVPHIDATSMVAAGSDIAGPDYGKPETVQTAETIPLKRVVGEKHGRGLVDGS